MVGKNYLSKKIIVGSANFGQKYGILKKKKLNQKDTSFIVAYAKKKNINYIDTSPNYGNSEKIIGKLNKKNYLKIITKIPKLPSSLKKDEINKWVFFQVKKSMKKLNTKKLYALLVHNAHDLLSMKGNALYKSILQFKNEGFTTKIGVSSYEPNQISKIIRKYKFDLVQVPLNLVDKRFENKKFLNRIKKKKIEVHARSIFLQGVLIAKTKILPRKILKLKNTWIGWEKWLKEKKLNPINVCMDYVLKNKKIDKIVIGCNSEDQLKEILNYKKLSKKFHPPKFKYNKLLMDPRNWI